LLVALFPTHLFDLTFIRLCITFDSISLYDRRVICEILSVYFKLQVCLRIEPKVQALVSGAALSVQLSTLRDVIEPYLISD
jgi:hypothetical protein